MNKTSQLICYGGVGEVTGANFMLDTGGAQLLVDCGLIQGKRFSAEVNCKDFKYDPAKVQTLLITHAHADHIGRIPKLIHDGYRGTIYATEATKALAAVMLDDALRVMRMEAQKAGEEPCYDENDIAQAMSLWKGVSYGEVIHLPDDVQATFVNAGHILGSAHVVLERGGKTFVFTGDIGNVPQPLLAAPDIPHGYEYLLMESVYGDRLHEGVTERSQKLRAYIEEAQHKNGTLIIPAFSLERTQAMLFEINNFVEKEGMKPIPVYLDSPLAIRVTDLYAQYTRYMRPEVQDVIKKGDDIFNFPGLHITETTQESRAIVHEKGAKIIIAGSGMSHGGRVISHEMHYLGDADATVLLVGYQGVGTLGRMLEDGAKRIKLHGKEVRVRAAIRKIDGYSGHADRDQLVNFVAEGGQKAKQIFVTMGEEKSSLFLTQRLRDFLGVPAVAPQEEGGMFTIDF